MKKTLILFLLIFLSTMFLMGCRGKKEEVKEEPVVFEENDFKKNMLDGFNTETVLEFEGRYIIGYMYSESFSTDENGTLKNGNLQLSGRALDPSDIGDESVVDGRKYVKNTTLSGDLDLVLPNGNSIRDFYGRYFIPLEYDWNLYSYEELDTESGRIVFNETKVGNEIINGRNAFVNQYTYIEFEGNKSDSVATKGTINRITIKSHIDISSYMSEFLGLDFGNKFMFADQINQALGDNFIEGILSIEEFKVVFE